MPAKQIAILCEYADAAGPGPAQGCAAGAGLPDPAGRAGRPPLPAALLKESFRLFVRRSLAFEQAGLAYSSPVKGR